MSLTHEHLASVSQIKATTASGAIPSKCTLTSLHVLDLVWSVSPSAQSGWSAVAGSGRPPQAPANFPPFLTTGKFGKFDVTVHDRAVRNPSCPQKHRRDAARPAPCSPSQ